MSNDTGRDDDDEALARRLQENDSVPIFPLSEVTLFPGQALPLHIFEPRYRRMLSDSLEGSRLIVLARLRPSYQDLSHAQLGDNQPSIYSVAGIGEIESHTKLPDGRSLIVLAGKARVRIDQELSTSLPYRRAKVALLDDRGDHSADVLRGPAEALIEQCRDFLQTSGGDIDALDKQLRLYTDDLQRVDFLCSTFGPGPSVRQSLLECLDPLKRIAMLKGVIERILHTAKTEEDLGLN